MKISMRNMLCLILVLTLLLILPGCKKNARSEETADTSSEITMEDVTEMQGEDVEDYDNGIVFNEEADGAEIVAKKKSVDDYVGSWKATSGQSLYQYGNVDLNIKEGGKWSGNVSDVDLEGEWSETSEGIHLTSRIFECELMFTESNVLVMRYTPNDDGNYITTVLSKQ